MNKLITELHTDIKKLLLKYPKIIKDNPMVVLNILKNLEDMNSNYLILNKNNFKKQIKVKKCDEGVCDIFINLRLKRLLYDSLFLRGLKESELNDVLKEEFCLLLKNKLEKED